MRSQDPRKHQLTDGDLSIGEHFHRQSIVTLLLVGNHLMLTLKAVYSIRNPQADPYNEIALDDYTKKLRDKIGSSRFKE